MKMERWQEIVKLLHFVIRTKREPAGLVPPDAILFVQAATKMTQKRPCSWRRASPLPDFMTLRYDRDQEPALFAGLPVSGIL